MLPTELFVKLARVQGEMDDPDYGEPVFGLLADFQERIKGIRGENGELRRLLEEAKRDLRWARRDTQTLRDEATKRDRDRKTERERLVEWLDRRIEQQEQAMAPRFISHERRAWNASPDS